MAARYYVEVYDTVGQRLALFDDWNSLNITHKLNGYSTHVLSFSEPIGAEDPRYQYFTKDAIVRVMRNDGNDKVVPFMGSTIGWYPEYVGFHRTTQRQIFETGLRLFTSYGRGFEDLLRRANIAWYSGSDESDKDAPAETAMKQYVDENMGAAALEVNGRVRDHIIPSFSVAPDNGLGPNWSGSRAWRNLLDILSEISDAASIDFSVELTSLTPPAFEFRTYYPRRGDDRTLGNAAGNASVVLSTNNGTMNNPSYTLSADDEVTQLIVLGQGQEAYRTIVVSGNVVASGASPWNDSEDTYNASFEEDDDALQHDGDAELLRKGEREQFEFAVVQQIPMLYARNYFLGDLVTVGFDQIQRNKRLVGVDIIVAEGKETIKPTFSDIAT